MQELCQCPVTSGHGCWCPQFQKRSRKELSLEGASISLGKDEKGKRRWEFTRRETYLMLVKVCLRDSEKLAQILSVVTRKTLTTCFLG